MQIGATEKVILKYSVTMFAGNENWYFDLCNMSAYGNGLVEDMSGWNLVFKDECLGSNLKEAHYHFLISTARSVHNRVGWHND